MGKIGIFDNTKENVNKETLKIKKMFGQEYEIQLGNLKIIKRGNFFGDSVCEFKWNFILRIILYNQFWS